MSLAARLALAFAAVVSVTAAVFGAVGLTAVDSGITSQVDRFLEERALELVDNTRSLPAADDPDNLQLIDFSSGDGQSSGQDGRGQGDDDHKRGQRRSVEVDALVQVLDRSGTPTVSIGAVLPVDRGDRELASGTGGSRRSVGIRFRTESLGADQFRIATAPLSDGGAVQVARELGESNSAVDQIQDQLLIALPLVALLAAGLGVALARRITRPLRSLSHSVDTVARTGDLRTEIEVTGDDEVGRLASGFGSLLDSLDRSRAKQQQLVEDVAHELRTPLTSIKANVDFLALAPDAEPEARADILARAQGELRELGRLIDEIVEVATDVHTPAHREPIDLSEVATEALARFRGRSDGRVVETALVPCRIEGDAETLIRAVGNLLSNADKYSPAAAPIGLVVTGDGRLQVWDRGPGIDPADRDRVFDRFYRGDRARSEPGSGLGLSIVASVVEAHGGTITIGEHPDGGLVDGGAAGTGTVVTITLESVAP